MPIVTPQAPQASLEALRTALPALIGSAEARRAAPRFAERVLASPRALAAPDLSFAVFTLGLADLAAGKDLDAAALSSWRHEFAREGEVVSAEVEARGPGRLSAINFVSPFGSVREALARAEHGEQTFAAGAWEASVLQISALGVRALWLKGREDVLIPLAPAPHGLVAGRRYNPRAFLDALRPAAEQVLAEDDPNRGA